MKSFLKDIIERAVNDDRIWSILDRTVLRAARYADWQHLQAQEPIDERKPIIDAAIKDICPDLIIKHGPFKGMTYLSQITSGSMLFPKLIGSYEREIQPLIERICGQGYSEIVDIGCAEGYYAVGLAKRIPSARVFAYDNNTQAITLARALAKLNGVEERLTFGDFCGAEELLAVPITRKGLIISDCEGYEKDLFSPDLIEKLAQHDLLIEVHDLVDIMISSTLRGRFSKTHNIAVIQSIDDIQKAHTYSYPELERYDLATRRILLGEYRSSVMEWFYLRSLSSQGVEREDNMAATRQLSS